MTNEDNNQKLVWDPVSQTFITKPPSEDLEDVKLVDLQWYHMHGPDGEYYVNSKTGETIFHKYQE